MRNPRRSLTLSSCFALSCLFARRRWDGFGVNGVLWVSRLREDDDLASSVWPDDSFVDDIGGAVRLLDCEQEAGEAQAQTRSAMALDQHN